MKFYSQPIPEHEEVPVADQELWEQSVQTWDERDEEAALEYPEHAVYVASISEHKDPLVQQAQLQEILALAKAQGSTVMGYECLTITRLRPRTLLGKGTARALADRCRQAGAGMLVLDVELSPSQMRNLEDEAGIKVCDREAVILNVFLKNARTRRARIQTEIAQLSYLRPRIRGVGLDMDQQMGGLAGSRGPGETASELLARKLDGRLAELKKAEARLRSGEQNRRKVRENCRRVALVGYTNAGKTAWMNALTSEALSSADQPFETLDSVTRHLSRHGDRVVLSDTVGFIRRLPERLMESFESTLEEIRDATLLVFVVDISDPEWRSHLTTTEAMVERLQAGEVPRFYLFNKLDAAPEAPDADVLKEAVGEHPSLLGSSRDPEFVAVARGSILAAARRDQERRTFFVPYGKSEAIKALYAECRVLETCALEEGLQLTVEGEASALRRVAGKLA